MKPNIVPSNPRASRPELADRRATEASNISAPAVSQLIAGLLADSAVTTVFSLMGEDTAALVTSLAVEQRMDVFTTRHEAAAVMAADAYAWATNGLGVAVLSHGPGLTNGLTAAVSAVRARRNLLIIAGHDAKKPAMRPDLKQSDQAALARAAGLSCTIVRDAADVAWSLGTAVAEARAGRSALLSVAVDVLNGQAPPVAAAGYVPIGGSIPVPSPTEPEIAQLARWLLESKRPVLIAGRGALEAKADIEELADRTGALLGTTLLGRGLFFGHRLDVGLVGGWASDSARPLLDDADLVVAFGASLNSFTMAFGNLFAQSRIVQVDVDPAQLGAHCPVDMGIVSDSGEAARRALARIGDAAKANAKRAHGAAPIAQQLYSGDDDSSELEADADVIATILDELVPEPRTVVSDVGHFAGAAGRYMQVRQPNHFRLTAAFASIGLGIGAAIGAAIARPDEQILFIAGDGGMLMSLGDLETVARYQLPLLIVIMNDRALGAERHFLEMSGLPHHQAVIGDVDFAAVATGLAIESATVRSPAELRALEPELTQIRRTPFLIDCKIRGDLRASWLNDMA